MSKELKCCPFCGGESICTEHSVDTDDKYGNYLRTDKWCEIQCVASCSFIARYDDYEKNQAILEWNNRAPRTEDATDAVALPKEDFERVKAILLGIDTYLDRNKLNYIASTSIGHKEIKEALSILEKEYKTMTEWQSVPKNMGERLGEDFLKALFSSDYDTPYVERVNAMLEAAPKPEPAETVEGLTEALKNCDEYAHGRYDVDIKVIEAARLWLRKQGE